MNEKYLKTISGILINVLNPFIIPTVGILLIMNHIPGFELFPGRIKTIVILIVFFSSCLLPLSFIGLITRSQLSTKIMSHLHDRAISYFFTAFSIFLGAQLLGRLPIPGLFRFLMIGASIILILLIVITLRWKISGHTASFGGIVATLIALSLKYGMNLMPGIIVMVLLSGVIGTILIYNEKNNPAQIYAGFIAGFIVMFSLIIFI